MEHDCPPNSLSILAQRVDLPEAEPPQTPTKRGAKSLSNSSPRAILWRKVLSLPNSSFILLVEIDIYFFLLLISVSKNTIHNFAKIKVILYTF